MKNDKWINILDIIDVISPAIKGEWSKVEMVKLLKDFTEFRFW